jgi:hypothetical protein
VQSAGKGLFGAAEVNVAAPNPPCRPRPVLRSLVGATGVAILVITACLAAMDAFPRLHRLAKPVIAGGSMSLTAYVYHIVGS